MTFSVCMPVLAVFLSGAVAGVFVMLSIGIHIGDRTHHLADKPTTHLDAITGRVLGVGVRNGCPQEIAAPKENDQCMLLIGAVTACA
jgi:hypothetical protein